LEKDLTHELLSSPNAGPYDIIYADPPWDYENWNKKWHENNKTSRWAGKKYPLMRHDEMVALPINEIAAKDSVLFMWTISTMLPKALDVMEAWGFKYKTIAFVWVKKNKIADSFFTGMGFWTRSNAEICLLGVKGKPLPRISRSVHQIIYTPIDKHSRKPAEARDKIVQLMGDRPRVELFAREKPDGWDVFGNEVEESIAL
jgi:N6-adenosine-specific RNA methylase IME4